MSKPAFASRSAFLAIALTATFAASHPASAAVGIGTLTPGHILISEVMPDPAKVSDTRGEWFEVFNTRPDDVNLAGLIVRSDGGTAGEKFIVTTDAILPAKGFFVFGRSTDTTLNGGFTANLAWGTAMSLGNASDYLKLELPDGTLLAGLSWSGSESGRSLEVHGGTLPGILPGDLGVAPLHLVYGLGDHGTPGAMNSVDFGVSGIAPVPEPGTYALLAAGLAGLTLRQARRKLALQR
jgi:hypothetical protein